MSTPLSLFAALRTDRWRAAIIALATGAGLAGAYLVTSQVTPTYEARSSVVLTHAEQKQTTRPDAAGPGDRAGASGRNATSGGPDDATTFDLSALQSMVPTVAHLAESTNVALAAAKSVHLPHDQVVGRVSADYEPGDTIITLTVSAPTAAMASAVANAVADIVHEQVDHGRMVLGRRGVLAVQALDRATPPAAPSTPKPALNLALGGMLGLMVGVAVVALAAQSDTRLRTPAQIEAELGLAVLGVVRSTRRSTRGGARMAFGRRRTAASVRATVASLSPLAGTPGRRLLVTSPTNSDAKTLVAALLGLGFADQGRPVTVIDTDLGLPRLAGHLPSSAGASLQRLLAEPSEAPATGDEMLRVVPAEAVSPALGRILLSSSSFRTLVDLAASHSDVVVLNGPPVLAGAGLAALADHVDTAILVVTTGSTPRSEAQRAAQILSQFDIPVAGVVVANASGVAQPEVAQQEPPAADVEAPPGQRQEPPSELEKAASTASAGTARPRRRHARPEPRR